jgi:quinol monooxygenase YgiN
MIHVIWNVELAPGCREAYLDIIRDYAAECRNESGCLGYEVAVPLRMPDALAQLAPFVDEAGVNENVVMLLGKWTDIATYERHFDQPYVRRCTEAVRHLLWGLEVQVLQSADDHFDSIDVTDSVAFHANRGI